MAKKTIKIQEVGINELKPSEYNPRKADKKQCEDLKESIKRFGLVDPLIVNGSEKRKNIIIGGHFRWRMAKDMGFKKVPVVYVNIKNIEREKELNLRLNKNSGGWDWDLLANFDVEDLIKWGFKEEELPFDRDFGETFSLRDGDKSGFQQITFTLADEQAKVIKEAIGDAKGLKLETYDNENSNGNAIYWIVKQWMSKK